ncbi:MAG TPA: hypothetical protein PKK10_00510 [Woeseiaceae bacterium]|nr:hypothetical protein [Woeseiaceae bacterium]
MNNVTATRGQSYEIVSIRSAEPPQGMEGSNWHRYVISFNGDDRIEGCRPGSMSVVTRAVEEIVAQLNERHAGKKGRVQLIPTPSKTAKSSARKTSS